MDRFVSNIRPYVPGCSDLWIEREVLSSAIEFCERSGAYTAIISQSVSKGDVSLVVAVPVDTDLVAIDKIVVGDIPTYAVDNEGNTVYFDGAAASDQTWDIYVSLKPLRDAVELPDILHNDWYQTIAAGAKANLMIMPGKPWTNPQMAMVHGGFFDDGVNNASKKAFYKNMPSEKRIARRMGI